MPNYSDDIKIPLKLANTDENSPLFAENAEADPAYRRPPPMPRPPGSKASVLFSNRFVAFMFPIVFVGILIRN